MRSFCYNSLPMVPTWCGDLGIVHTPSVSNGTNVQGKVTAHTSKLHIRRRMDTNCARSTRLRQSQNSSPSTANGEIALAPLHHSHPPSPFIRIVNEPNCCSTCTNRSEIFHQRFWSDAQHPAPQLVPFQRSLHAAEIEHEEELERQREQEAMARRRRTLDDPDAPPPPLSPTSFSRTTSSSFPFSDSRQASGSSEPPPLPAHHPTASASEPPPLPGNHPRSPMPPPRPASTLSTPPQSRPMSTLSTGSGTKDMYTMPRKRTGPPALPARDGIPEVCVSGETILWHDPSSRCFRSVATGARIR